MARGIFKIITAALAVSAAVSAAQASGFSRGSADTDILFEEGNFNIRSGVTYVSPTRKFSSHQGNPALVGTDYTDGYAIFSGAIKLNLNDDFRCAGSFSQPYGGSVSYDALTGTIAGGPGKLSENFSVNEWGLTCASLKFGWIRRARGRFRPAPRSGGSGRAAARSFSGGRSPDPSDTAAADP